jgi:hypothetical protein
MIEDTDSSERVADEYSEYNDQRHIYGIQVLEPVMD